MHWVYRTVISGTHPIITPLQPIALGATSEVHWFYGLCLSISITHDFPGMNGTTDSKIPPTPLITNKKIQYYYWLGHVTTISQQIYTHDFAGKKDNFIQFLNYIPFVNDKLISPLLTSIRKMILLVKQPINHEYDHPPLRCNQQTAKKRITAKFNKIRNHYKIPHIRNTPLQVHQRTFISPNR